MTTTQQAVHEVRGAWSAWVVPAGAISEWMELQVALAVLDRRTPCAEQPELWFTRAQSPRVEDAVYGCLRCPVVDLCRSYALAADERDGVWGGLTEVERRELAGRRR